MSGRYRKTGSHRLINISYIRRSHQCRKGWDPNAGWVLQTRVEETVETDTIHATSDEQEMSDTVGMRDTYNGVFHTKLFDFPLSGAFSGAALMGPIPPWNQISYDWMEYGQSFGPVDSPGSFSFQLVYGDAMMSLPDPTFPAIDWSDLVYRVGSQLDGRMTTGQNMITSLVQIAQTVGMIKNPFGLCKLVKSGMPKATLSKLLKLPANAYLEYQFGWKNFKKDIDQVIKVWNEVRTHQQYLKESVDKFVSMSARQTDKVSTSIYPQPIFNSMGQNYFSLVPHVAYVERVATFSLDVRREEGALIWSNFDQVVSRLGARDVAAALWDLVPFSFVVDWFTHINRFVEQRSIDWGAYDIRKPGHSVRTKWYGTVDWKSKCFIPWSQQSREDTGNLGTSCVQSTYVRTAGFPAATSSVGLFGNLNQTQLAEGIALIVQRR